MKHRIADVRASDWIRHEDGRYWYVRTVELDGDRRWLWLHPPHFDGHHVTFDQYGGTVRGYHIDEEVSILL